METIVIFVVLVCVGVAVAGLAFLRGAAKLYPPDDPAEEKKETATYFSRRHGWRVAEIVDRRKGRVILHVLAHPPGVTVRRQSHLLVKEGR